LVEIAEADVWDEASELGVGEILKPRRLGKRPGFGR